MKGIYQQIRELGENKYELPTKKEFENFCDKMIKNDIKNRQKVEKNRKENFDHLEKRAKELNEEIPFELLLRVQTAPEGILWVGSEFLNKYKKWLE